MAFPLDEFAAKFRAVFARPIDHFFVDKEAGDNFAWPAGLSEWSTESAVDDLFEGELSADERGELAARLEEESPSWFKQAEFFGRED